ncbi:MAG: retroviral-like aspartic protease family protein [Deltaproteobacteria bacterium]|nr:retroviral-like aspartic protease family protein [Deltaproteobacteria bacterium]MCL5276677.1 retroviral-like aspartic protease family protein [Deltaproteobacteria bacterium]
MPSFISQQPTLISNGPIMSAKIGLPKVISEALQKQGKPVPSPIQANALIDTGASGSHISPKKSKLLGLTPHGVAQMFTAGNPTMTNVFVVSLDIGVLFGSPMVIDPIAVIEAPLIGQTNIDCIIGRDILSRSTLIYIGYVNTFSLSI